MKQAGLIFDHSTHFLDHLAPFCALNKCPLLLCDGSLADLAHHYYPDLEILEGSPLEITLPPTVITCDTSPLLRAAFPHQTPEILWLPHGNSDKGMNGPFFEALLGEKTALVYGQKMSDHLREKGIHLEMIPVGNFRLRYFEKHRPFYQTIIEQEIKTLLPKGNRNFLYAPTWEDSDQNGSFWEAFPLLAKALPDTDNLLVKLHPNTYQKFDLEIEKLIGEYQEKKNIVFLPEFPPIYPLLHFCDAYIGDMSSIGYDFLSFDKPMFFLSKNSETTPYLFRCGQTIAPHLIFTTEEKKGAFTAIRKQTYDYTFHAASE